MGGAGWCVAAFDLAAAGFDGLDDALGFGGEAFLAAEVEDLGLPAENGGDDPGFAGQAAGGAGADRLAGVEPRGFEPALRVSSDIITTTVALRPPVLGSLLAG